MDCRSPDLSDSEFLLGLGRKIARERIPISGSIALTARCNLTCVHCYARTWRAQIPAGELQTARWQAILDQVVQAGCLQLLITGGEPLLRRDFGAVFSHAVRSGLLVTVFSNGTLVTDETADLFAELPPRSVEITLYGASRGTYERITGQGLAFDHSLRGIERLLERRVRVSLKTVVLSANVHEIERMRQIAEGYGVRFRLDAALAPRLDGDREPLAYRVSPRTAVALELADPEHRRTLKEYWERARGAELGEGLYACGAGLTGFHIGARGDLVPCVMCSEPAFSLTRDGDFAAGWRGVIASVRLEKPTDPAYRCNACQIRQLCGACPPFSQLETGSASVPSEYVCALARNRQATLMEGS
jgi:radical SAM protein with 4Fe4S-binding SPASM domain